MGGEIVNRCWFLAESIFTDSVNIMVFIILLLS